MMVDDYDYDDWLSIMIRDDDGGWRWLWWLMTDYDW